MCVGEVQLASHSTLCQHLLRLEIYDPDYRHHEQSSLLLVLARALIYGIPFVALFRCVLAAWSTFPLREGTATAARRLQL